MAKDGVETRPNGALDGILDGTASGGLCIVDRKKQRALDVVIVPPPPPHWKGKRVRTDAAVMHVGHAEIGLHRLRRVEKGEDSSTLDVCMILHVGQLRRPKLSSLYKVVVKGVVERVSPVLSPGSDPLVLMSLRDVQEPVSVVVVFTGRDSVLWRSFLQPASNVLLTGLNRARMATSLGPLVLRFTSKSRIIPASRLRASRRRYSAEREYPGIKKCRAARRMLKRRDAVRGNVPPPKVLPAVKHSPAVRMQEQGGNLSPVVHITGTLTEVVEPLMWQIDGTLTVLLPRHVGSRVLLGSAYSARPGTQVAIENASVISGGKLLLLTISSCAYVVGMGKGVQEHPSLPNVSSPYWDKLQGEYLPVDCYRAKLVYDDIRSRLGGWFESDFDRQVLGSLNSGRGWVRAVLASCGIRPQVHSEDQVAQFFGSSRNLVPAETPLEYAQIRLPRLSEIASAAIGLSRRLKRKSGQGRPVVGQLSWVISSQELDRELNCKTVVAGLLRGSYCSGTLQIEDTRDFMPAVVEGDPTQFLGACVISDTFSAVVSISSTRQTSWKRASAVTFVLYADHTRALTVPKTLRPKSIGGGLRIVLLVDHVHPVLRRHGRVSFYIDGRILGTTTSGTEVNSDADKAPVTCIKCTSDALIHFPAILPGRKYELAPAVKVGDDVRTLSFARFDLLRLWKEDPEAKNNGNTQSAPQLPSGMKNFREVLKSSSGDVVSLAAVFKGWRARNRLVLADPIYGLDEIMLAVPPDESVALPPGCIPGSLIHLFRVATRVPTQTSRIFLEATVQSLLHVEQVNYRMAPVTSSCFPALRLGDELPLHAFRARVKITHVHKALVGVRGTSMACWVFCSASDGSERVMLTMRSLPDIAIALGLSSGDEVALRKQADDMRGRFVSSDLLEDAEEMEPMPDRMTSRPRGEVIIVMQVRDSRRCAHPADARAWDAPDECLKLRQSILADALAVEHLNDVRAEVARELACFQGRRFEAGADPTAKTTARAGDKHVHTCTKHEEATDSNCTNSATSPATRPNI